MSAINNVAAKWDKISPLDSVLHNTIFGKPATPAATPALPTEDDAAVKKAQTDSINAQMARSGRASTLLTGTGSDTLG